MSAHDGRISPLPPHSSEESSERSFNAVTNVSDAKVASSAPTANSNDGTATPKAEESTHLAHGSWWHTHYIFPHIISKPLFVLYIVTGLIIAIYALCYLHATWDPMSHLPNVPVAICNDDVGYQALGDYDPPSQAVAKALTNGGTPVGQSITSGLLNTPALRNRLAWNDLSGQKLTHEDIISLVDHGDYWGVVYIPANFSDNFLTNLRLNVSGTGAPRAAVPLSAEYIFDQGRSLTVSNYVSGVVTASMSALSQQFGMKLLNATESNPNIVKPVFYMSPFSLASGKRHAVLTFGANLVTYIVLLLMWLGAMLSVTVIHKVMLPQIPHLTGVKTHPSHHPVRFNSLQIILATHLAGFLFSFVQASIVFIIVYTLPHITDDGTDLLFSWPPGLTYGFIWFFSFACIGLVNVFATLVGPDAFPLIASLLLILQLVSSGGLVDHVAMPEFFKIGYGLPFYHGLKIMKVLLFNSQAHTFTRSYLVLTAYIVGTFVVSAVIGSLRLSKWKKSRLVTDMEVLGGSSKIAAV